VTYGPHLELTVLVSDAARLHHLPLYSEIVHRAHKRGLAGASVFRGVEGFGHTHRIHEPRIFDFASHTPVVVVIVDTEARVREFLPELHEMVGDVGVVTIHPVEMLAPAIGRR
jgi:uncharacterized protein